MKKTVYVVGSSNTDMVVKADRLPRPGETIMGGTFFMNAGGKGANQAVAAARLGAQVVFVANVGNDIFGTQSILHFNQEKIHTAFVTSDAELPSGVALIGVDSRGENCITVAAGANANLGKQHIAKAMENAPPGIVLVQLEIPLPSVEYTVLLAKKRGHTVILNPAPAQKLPAAVFKDLTYITPNETEAALLTGIPVTDAASAASAAKRLCEMGVPNVIITLGSKGCYIHTQTISMIIPTPSFGKVLDTTAAGDCFNGAFAVALSEERTLEEAAGFACVAAALTVTRLGAQASMPYRNELPDNANFS